MLTDAIVLLKAFVTKPMNTSVASVVFWAKSNDRGIVSLASKSANMMNFTLSLPKV
jgi:hypothetical protein